MKKAGVLLIALGILIAFFVFGMGVTASHKTGVLNDRQNIIYLSGILFLSGIILFGFGIFDKKNKVINSDKVFFNSTKMISWIFRIGIFAIVLFLVVVSAIKIDNWYNYDRHKEKIDLVVHFNNNNECDYQNQVQVKITNNSVRTISETKIWVIVTVRGYSKPINRLWDSLDSYKIIEPGEEWSSCWSIVTSEGERLDSSGKEVHLESFSVNFKSEEESRKLQADRIAANVSQKACDAGDAKECFSLGKKYDNGQGVKQNYFAAANLYQKACEGGNPKGCFNLGVMYSDGQGVKRDYLAAINLFQKVCNEGVAMGCYNLGVIYEYGKGMTQNTQKGLELYGKSCDMRDQNGCDAYERLKNSDM